MADSAQLAVRLRDMDRLQEQNLRLSSAIASQASTEAAFEYDQRQRATLRVVEEELDETKARVRELQETLQAEHKERDAMRKERDRKDAELRVAQRRNDDLSERLRDHVEQVRKLQARDLGGMLNRARDAVEVQFVQDHQEYARQAGEHVAELERGLERSQRMLFAARERCGDAERNAILGQAAEEQLVAMQGEMRRLAQVAMAAGEWEQTAAAMRRQLEELHQEQHRARSEALLERAGLRRTIQEQRRELSSRADAAEVSGIRAELQDARGSVRKLEHDLQMQRSAAAAQEQDLSRALAEAKVLAEQEAEKAQRLEREAAAALAAAQARVLELGEGGEEVMELKQQLETHRALLRMWQSRDLALGRTCAKAQDDADVYAAELVVAARSAVARGESGERCRLRAEEAAGRCAHLASLVGFAGRKAADGNAQATELLGTSKALAAALASAGREAEALTAKAFAEGAAAEAASMAEELNCSAAAVDALTRALQESGQRTEALAEALTLPAVFRLSEMPCHAGGRRL
eukprot:Hpha_TRINITY_DN9055_c0_g1::TRINITY_DN9055_c0_g1_i2::g.141930::m.141930